MKCTVVTAVFALLLGATALPTFAQTSPTLAPADRYFGRMQMSIIEIRNRLKDLTLLAEARPDEAPQVLGKAELVEDALRSWARQFPGDPWIPKFSFNLVQLYDKLNSDDARQHAVLMTTWLSTTYPGYGALLDR
jgi:hypothetical protein